MNKVLSVIITICLISVLFCGCTSKKDESAVQNNEPANTTQTVEVPQQETVDTSGFIGENRAKEIALGEAGLTSEGVFFGRVELDNEDGIWQYEVDFRKGKTEYEAAINAEDGTVISFETETID